MDNSYRLDKQAYWGILLLAMTGLACYFGSLNAPPETEELGLVDYPLILRSYPSFWQWLLQDFIRKMHFIRPVPFFIQGAIVTSLQDHTRVLRLINLAALVATSSLLYLLLWRENVKWLFALLGGAVIIIHPINVINVLKLIHLGNLLGGMFCLLAITLYARYRDRARSGWTYGLEGLIVALMLFSYELYVVSPILLVLYEYFIKAKAKLRGVKQQKLIRSLALWILLIMVYLAIRYWVFRGVGGYRDFWESNPLAPFLKGGKWLPGWGFLHILGQPLGILDFALALILGIIFLVIFANRPNLSLLLFALLWFVGASLPYFVITATYHYVFSFSMVGFIVALALGLDRLVRAGGKKPAATIAIIALILFLGILIYGRPAAIASVVESIKDDSIPSQILADHVGNGGDAVTIFLASERSDSHLLVRVRLLLHPTKVEIRDLVLPLSDADVGMMMQEDQADSAKKVYALRQGRRVTFYPSLIELIEEAKHL